MKFFNNLLADKPPLIGMVHLKALPGTAGFSGNIEEIYESAVEDARRLAAGGMGGIMVENFSDMPYAVKLDTAQRTALAAVSREVKKSVSIAVGVDAALSDYKGALAAAVAAGADFVRIAVFVDTVDSFAGIIQPCAAEAIKYRKKIGGEQIKIFADVQVKYTHMIKDTINIVESAVNAQACMADGIIVTGSKTGEETPLEAVKRVKEKVNLPVLIGSGAGPDNIVKQMAIADGAIIGSSLKEEGKVTKPVDQKRVELLVKNFNSSQ
ncbi:MAG: BtpA/SgcQ family protein [Firmicutes bacterium]|nr:BtpA/SgcQ family protein [Bacillota bacterium]